MRLISTLVFCLIAMKIGVVAELTASACSLLRTTASMATIVPEMLQVAMRYYDVASPAEVNRREKRFVYGDTALKESGVAKASVFEQVASNAFKDVNYTRVAHLIFNNNETMAKIRQNIDVNAIVHAAMREVDYEKLGSSLYYNAEAEFDLEYIITSLLHITHLDLIYEELITNGTLSPALIKSLHPDINVQTVQKILDSSKNFIQQFGKTMNSTQNLEEYLFEKVQQYALTPLGKMIQEVKKENPTTLDQLVEIVLNNLNKAVKEQVSPTATTKKPPMNKKSLKTTSPSSTTLATAEDHPHEDVKLLLYQCSIAIQSIGHIAETLIVAVEELYCTTIWD